MSALVKSFPHSAFANIEFPYVEVAVKGSLRHFVHEFFHAPGGEVEELARRLYEIEFTCDFHDVFVSFPNLWPEGLHRLRTVFEKGQVAALTIPQIGIIQARCIEWEQRLVAKAQSGEKVRFKFLEEARSENITTAAIATSVAALVPIAATLHDEAAKLGTDLFDGVEDVMNSIVAVGDQVDLVNNQLVSKLQGLTDTCNRLDKTIQDLNKPQFHEVLNQLHELGVAAFKLSKDILKKSRPTDLFIVPALMTVSQVSNFIYGETSSSTDLLKLNDFDDAFSIPAGSKVRYYVPDQQAAA